MLRQSCRPEIIMSNTVKPVPAKPVASTADSGKVRVGNGMKRFATKDSGKVRVGNGMKRF